MQAQNAPITPAPVPASSGAQRLQRALRWLGLISLLLLLWFALVDDPRSDLPKRFDVVEPGRLYRSGEISAQELEHVAATHGLKTVLSLLNPDVPESIAEREAAERLGLRWLNVPLTGDGASTPEQRQRIREIILDPSFGPMLVHCAAGANRTGLACGMYRIHQQGWSYEQVIDEMRRYGFKDKDHHENLRDALRQEAAAAAANRPVAPQP